LLHLLRLSPQNSSLSVLSLRFLPPPLSNFILFSTRDLIFFTFHLPAHSFSTFCSSLSLAAPFWFLLFILHVPVSLVQFVHIFSFLRYLQYIRLTYIPTLCLCNSTFYLYILSYLSVALLLPMLQLSLQLFY
jgi:hypothetical protein